MSIPASDTKLTSLDCTLPASPLCDTVACDDVLVAIQYTYSVENTFKFKCACRKDEGVKDATKASGWLGLWLSIYNTQLTLLILPSCCLFFHTITYLFIVLLLTLLQAFTSFKRRCDKCLPTFTSDWLADNIHVTRHTVCYFIYFLLIGPWFVLCPF